jgi:hypothetical protein
MSLIEVSISVRRSTLCGRPLMVGRPQSRGRFRGAVVEMFAPVSDLTKDDDDKYAAQFTRLKVK